MVLACIVPSSASILSLMDVEEKINWIAEQLLYRYGEIEITRSDPVEELITTILSQNTNDTNRDRAYSSLIERFGTLEAVKDAPVDEIAEAIKIGGLHNQKSIRIKNVLARIMRERGSFDISFLAFLIFPVKPLLSKLRSIVRRYLTGTFRSTSCLANMSNTYPFPNELP